MANPKVTTFSATDFQRKGAKTPSLQYRVNGTLTVPGVKDAVTVTSGIITAPTAKQAALYFLAHARYLGLSGTVISATEA